MIEPIRSAAIAYVYVYMIQENYVANQMERLKRQRNWH